MTALPKILVVDADERRRAAKIDMLGEAGFTVSGVGSGEAALSQLVEALADVVILDIALPDTNGIEVCRQIKRDMPSILVLQTSSTLSESVDRARSLDNGADGYLVEPIEPVELVASVHSLVRLHAMQQALRDSEARLQLAQDGAGMVMLDWDIPTDKVVTTAKFAALFGLASDRAIAWDDILARVHPDDRGQLDEKFKSRLRQGGQFDEEFRILSIADGIRWITSRGQFIRDASGRSMRMLCVNSDITDRKKAEQRNAQLASIVASSPDAIVSLDRNDIILTWNAGAEALFGVGSADAIGHKVDFEIPPDRMLERTEAMRRLYDGESLVYITERRRKDGHKIEVSISGAALRAADGTVTGASLIIRDISLQNEREQHVRFLLRELTHRSKNLLAVIQAMARQSLSHLASPEEFVTRFSERLGGLAGSHDLLSNDDWEGTSLAAVVKSQLRGYDDLIGGRITSEGPHLLLRPEAAQNIGIALHELSTNAAKYGALSAPRGRIVIAWELGAESDDQRLRMSWEEADGPPVAPPTRKGFGQMVMDRITGQSMGGSSKVEFAPGGIVWMLDVPAAAVLKKADAARKP